MANVHLHWRSNSGLHAWEASTLPTEPTPSPVVPIFKVNVRIEHCGKKNQELIAGTHLLKAAVVVPVAVPGG